MNIRWIWIFLVGVILNMVLFAPPINQLNKGDIIPELVWKDRSIKKDVKLINVVGGRVILGVEGTTEALRLDDFQKLVKLTNESLETVREEFEAKKQAQALEDTRKAEAAAAAAGSGASDNPFDLAGRPAAPKPMPKPMPKPAVPAGPSPFGSNPMPKPAVPTPSPSFGSNPMPKPAVPTPSSSFGSNPMPLSPAPAASSPFATSIPERPASVQPSDTESMVEPPAVKILRESIHARMSKLQDDYLLSLRKLKDEYAASGNAVAARQVTQAIEFAEEEKSELTRLQAGVEKKSRAQPEPPPSPSPRNLTVAPVVAPTIPSTGLDVQGLSIVPQSPTPVQPRVNPSPSTQPGALAGKPRQLSSGQVPVVVGSINEGEMPGLAIERIERWGALKQEMFERKPYWTVEIDYQADSIFGKFPARAKALVQGSTVKWITAPR